MNFLFDRFCPCLTHKKLRENKRKTHIIKNKVKKYDYVIINDIEHIVIDDWDGYHLYQIGTN